MRETFSITMQRDIPVEMRDGTVLYADLYRREEMVEELEAL